MTRDEAISKIKAEMEAKSKELVKLGENLTILEGTTEVSAIFLIREYENPDSTIVLKERGLQEYQEDAWFGPPPPPHQEMTLTILIDESLYYIPTEVQLKFRNYLRIAPENADVYRIKVNGYRPF